MRILQMEAPSVGGQGDHVYRTRQPCRALGEEADVLVASGSWLTPELHRLLPGADVLVVCDVVDADLLPVFAERRRRGQLTIYEVNDHFRALQSWNQTAYLAENLLTRSLSAQLAAKADANQFTVAELQRDFGALNPRHVVFSNQLWEVPPLRERPPHAETWLGWGGSLGHREDLRWVMPVLQQALSRHPSLKLAIMGPEELQSMFSWAPPGRFRFTRGDRVERYYEFLDGLDLGICPLLPTDFNRCRSDVKFLELAAHGVTALCSRLAPYAATVRDGETGILWSSLPELSRSIDELVSSPQQRTELSRAAHAYVASERDERAHSRERLDFYQGELRRAPQGQARDGVGDAAWEDLAARPESFPGSRYHLLSGSEIETLLYRALTLGRDGRGQEALPLYKQAARRAPHFHVPSLLMGASEPDSRRALDALELAVRLAPGAPSASLLLATRREVAGDLAGAQAELERCRTLSADFGAAETRLAALAERAGRGDEARDLYRAALAANPYFAEPALRLGLLAIDAGEPAEAAAILERALEHDDGLWSLRFFLGRALLAAGEPRAALAQLEHALPLAPDPGPVLAQLAQAHVRLGNVEAAGMIVAEIRRLAQRPSDPAAAARQP